MKILVFLALLGLHSAAGVTHSLKYFYTASSNVPNFPEFVNLGMVDDQQIDYYDSDTKKAVPKQDWMDRVTADDSQYWERETQISFQSQQVDLGDMVTLKKRFNQTGGVHVIHYMIGCEWDDETGEVNGFHNEGYDGEDFVAFDLKTETWIAPTPQAVITKYKWDNDKGYNVQKKNYLTQICPDWLKKYVNYGRSSLMRTERPSTHSLLQKTSSSPVSCFATGFYPNRAEMFWRKDGHQIHENVERGEILPNNDGSFQMSVELDLSSVTPEDWRRYECVFQLSGVTDDIIIKLDKAVIRTNKKADMTIAIIVAVVVLAVVLIAAIGFVAYKKKKTKCPPPPPSDNGSDSTVPLNQKA